VCKELRDLETDREAERNRHCELIHERKKSRWLSKRDFEEDGDAKVHERLGRKTERQIDK
jgi:hypothetical protein